MAVTARDLGLERAGDQLHLYMASERGSILVSHNVADYRLLHNAWLLWSERWGVTTAHARILLLPHGPPAINKLRISDLVDRGRSLANELFEWRRGVGWQ